MLRRTVVTLLAACLVVAAGVLPAGAQESDGSSPGGGAESALPPAKAWVLADADSGAVLAALNHHDSYPIASLVKVMTALVAIEELGRGSEIEVSELAAAQPAMRIGMEAGQRWKLQHALHSLLLVSANDAAYALAEAAGGSLQGFADLMQREGERLGMSDSTWLDPAGFDGDEGFKGGSRASAYDLAILARKALETAPIPAIVKKPEYEFAGSDGVDHRLLNHNKMLATYPGLTGLKTGFTRAAGHTLIATAERDGRRLIAVVVGAADMYGTAGSLLDQGFATDADTEGIGEPLPDLPEEPVVGAEETTEVAAASAPATALASSGGGIPLRRITSVVVIALLIAFFARREQIKRRKRRRRAMRRAYLIARRRGMIDIVDAERYFGPEASGPDEQPVQVVTPRGERRSPDDGTPHHNGHGQPRSARRRSGSAVARR